MADVIELSTIKEFLRIGHSRMDTVLEILRDAALGYVEGACGVLFDPDQTTRTEYLDGGGRFLRTSSAPIVSIASITDTLNLTVRDATLYRSDGRRSIARLDIAGGHPASRWERGVERYKVVFIAGYTLATIPAGLKLAILQLIERAYSASGAKASESGAGHSINWSTLGADSDIAEMLRPFEIGGLAE